MNKGPRALRELPRDLGEGDRVGARGQVRHHREGRLTEEPLERLEIRLDARHVPIDATHHPAGKRHPVRFHTESCELGVIETAKLEAHDQQSGHRQCPGEIGHRLMLINGCVPPADSFDDDPVGPQRELVVLLTDHAGIHLHSGLFCCDMRRNCRLEAIWVYLAVGVGETRPRGLDQCQGVRVAEPFLGLKGTGGHGLHDRHPGPLIPKRAHQRAGDDGLAHSGIGSRHEDPSRTHGRSARRIDPGAMCATPPIAGAAGRPAAPQLAP